MLLEERCACSPSEKTCLSSVIFKARKVRGKKRICPFWGKFLIDSKYLYKEKEICFGIIGQMWSRICMTIPTIIWHIFSYGVLKMCAF